MLVNVAFLSLRSLSVFRYFLRPWLFIHALSCFSKSSCRLHDNMRSGRSSGGYDDPSTRCRWIKMKIVTRTRSWTKRSGWVGHWGVTRQLQRIQAQRDHGRSRSKLRSHRPSRDAHDRSAVHVPKGKLAGAEILPGIKLFERAKRRPLPCDNVHAIPIWFT